MSSRARRTTAATVAVVLAGLALTVTGLAGAYSSNALKTAESLFETLRDLLDVDVKRRQIKMRL